MVPKLKNKLFYYINGIDFTLIKSFSLKYTYFSFGCVSEILLKHWGYGTKCHAFENLLILKMIAMLIEMRQESIVYFLGLRIDEATKAHLLLHLLMAHVHPTSLFNLECYGIIDGRLFI